MSTTKLIEPVMGSLLDDIYQRYVDALNGRLIDEGTHALHAIALAVMSLVERPTVFLERSRRWEREAKAARESVLEFIDIHYRGDE